MQDFFQQIEQEKQSLQEQLVKLQEQNTHQNDGEQVAKLEEELGIIRNFLPTIARKQILADYEKYALVQQELKKIDGELTQYEQQAQKMQEYQLELQTCDTQIQSLHQQNIQLKEKYDKSILQQKEYTTQLSQLDYSTIQQGQNLVRSMDNTLHSIKTLIDDFSEILIKVKKLTHDEGLSKNLYNALSKDLILFVLEDNLPVLSEIINNFLSAIVEFQIDMKLAQRGSALELDTTITDQKGIRETKSLSGGQKVILKLVWMLAVSVYSQSKMLFLDETINNLDPDTVAKVAELLQNFAQQNTIKMYVVSHSSEIKSMNIWD